MLYSFNSSVAGVGGTHQCTSHTLSCLFIPCFCLSFHNTLYHWLHVKLTHSLLPKYIQYNKKITVWEQSQPRLHQPFYRQELPGVAGCWRPWRPWLSWAWLFWLFWLWAYTLLTILTSWPWLFWAPALTAPADQKRWERERERERERKRELGDKHVFVWNLLQPRKRVTTCLKLTTHSVLSFVLCVITNNQHI